MSQKVLQSLCVAVVATLALGAFTGAANAATNGAIAGEILFITLDDPGDPWSGGTMVIGSQEVIIPRNLLIDLPANRLTLRDLFNQAPPVCASRGETGLARADTCLLGGPGGVASILANRTDAGGNIIAGDVFVEKAQEALGGVVTFIDHTDGYFRINGITGDSTTGTMIRINDPSGRFTIQQGLGCGPGGNCSPDERFGVDPDNYTITFSTGYPACLPSTTTGGNRVTGSDAAGLGDPFCPDSNRAGASVADSSRFAPIQLGDHVTADGNYETIAGTTYLSAHTLTVSAALTTGLGQPDYLIFDEVEWDVPGFQNERVRALMILFTTLGTSQLDVFALHVDPTTNENNEFPLGSTVNNPDTVNQGIPPTQAGIARIRYDVDFVAPIDDRRSPCTNLNNAGFAACVNEADTGENFDILSPVTREIIARSRNKTLNPSLQAFDVAGNDAPWGEYLTPVGLGHPEFGEIDLNRVDTPFIFAGIPWNLDRRLSPGGCDGPCDLTPQPLDPFPFSGLDPRTQAGIPVGFEDELFAFFPFGPTDFLSWPPPATPAFPITPPPAPPQVCQVANSAPVAGDDVAVTDQDTAVNIDVLANDSDLEGALDPSSVTVVLAASNGGTVVEPDGSITYTPDPGFVGNDSFTYTVADLEAAVSNQATVTVMVVDPNLNEAPVANDDFASTALDVDVSIDVLANDTDSDGTLDPATVVVVSPASNGTATPQPDGTILYSPNLGFEGIDTFTYTVDDNEGTTSNEATVTVSVAEPNDPPIAVDDVAQAVSGIEVDIDVVANDTDPDGTLNLLSVLVVSQPSNGSAISNGDGTIAYVSLVGFTGIDTFTYTVSDDDGAVSNEATVTVTVDPAPVVDNLVIDRARFKPRNNNGEWRIDGTSTVTTGNMVTVYLGPTVGGTVIGTTTVEPDGTWRFEDKNSTVLPGAETTVSAASTAGGIVEGFVFELN